MSKKTYRPMRALILAGVLSLAAASAVHAGGHVSGGDFHSGASAAPICDGTGRSQKTANDGRLFRDLCRVIAGDGGPGTAGDNNGRTVEGTHAYPVLATDGPGSPTDGTGRSAEIETAHPVLADDTGPHKRWRP